MYKLQLVTYYMFIDMFLFYMVVVAASAFVG